MKGKDNMLQSSQQIVLRKPYQFVSHPSINYNSRNNNKIECIVLHYTDENREKSLSILDGSLGIEVSAHILISDEYVEGQSIVYDLVNALQNAWHAGVSQWQKKAKPHLKTGKLTLNYNSFGIEIVNENQDIPEKEGGGIHFEPFQEHQITAIIAICKELIEKYNIDPTCFVGHSDIAEDLGRKSDPGPLFPWRKLAEAGIGAWYDKEMVEKWQSLLPQEQNISLVQKALETYGYGISDDTKPASAPTRALQMFQMHFRQSDYKGQLDRETNAILFNLVCKYFPQSQVALDIQHYLKESYSSSHANSFFAVKTTQALEEDPRSADSSFGFKK